MNPDSEKTKRSAILIAVVFIALAAGFGSAKFLEWKITAHKITANSTATSQIPDTATKAADLRTSLVILGIQHTQLLDSAIRAAIDQTSDATALKTELYQNGTDISALLGSYYGTSTQTSFKTLWNTQLNDVFSYATAATKGDASSKAMVLADLQTNFNIPLAKLLSGVNPEIEESSLQATLATHLNLTSSVIDDHQAKNYAQEQVDLAASDSQFASCMSRLAEAIVTQYPARF